MKPKTKLKGPDLVRAKSGKPYYKVTRTYHDKPVGLDMRPIGIRENTQIGPVRRFFRKLDPRRRRGITSDNPRQLYKPDPEPVLPGMERHAGASQSPRYAATRPGQYGEPRGKDRKPGEGYDLMPENPDKPWLPGMKSHMRDTKNVRIGRKRQE
jgi:hypothetical protein